MGGGDAWAGAISQGSSRNWSHWLGTDFTRVVRLVLVPASDCRLQSRKREQLRGAGVICGSDHFDGGGGGKRIPLKNLFWSGIYGWLDSGCETIQGTNDDPQSPCGWSCQGGRLHGWTVKNSDPRLG